MFDILRSQKRYNIKKIENQLFHLVEKKENYMQSIDDQGRALVMSLREYLENNNSNIKYNKLMKEAKRYINQNKHYH